MKPISVLLETKDVMQFVKIQGNKNLRGGGGGGCGLPPSGTAFASNAGSCCHLVVERLAAPQRRWEPPAVSPCAPCGSVSKTH